MFPTIFKIIESSGNITITRRSSLISKLILIVIFCALVISLIIHNYVLILMIGSSLLLIGLPILVIRFIYYHKYPTDIYVFRGSIVMQFSRLILHSRLIKITSNDTPAVLANICLVAPYGFTFGWDAQVSVESAKTTPIMIYFKIERSDKEASVVARQVAKMISDKTGFNYKIVGCTLTSSSSCQLR